MLPGPNQAPSLHVLKKTLYGPCDEARALTKAARAVRYTEEIAPVFFGNKIIGSVFGDRYGNVYVSKINALDFMGFPNGYADIITAVRNGQSSAMQFTVVANGGFTSNVWSDIWNTQASSQANAYSGTAITARQFTNTSDGALNIGDPVSTKTKHLIGAGGNMSGGNSPGLMMWVYDRVLSYDKCTIALSTQTMTNTLTAQRWTGSGFPGLRIMLTGATVALGATASRLTGLVYANEVSVGSKNVPLTTQIDVTANTISNSVPCAVLKTNVANSAFDLGPFLPLNKGDIGASSITSYIFSAANTGDLCYALIRPLVMWVGPTSGNAVEVNFVKERLVLPRVYDTSCIGMLCYASDNSATTFTLTGTLNYAWN